jgi:hypothetical protein
LTTTLSQATAKKKMTENPAELRPKKPPTTLFLETSAQIQRLVGTQQMQDGINELIYADPKPKIGTSATVKREFDHTCIGIFRKLEQAALTLSKPASLVPFEDLLLEIKGQVGPYYPGGPDFLLYIYTKLSAKFGAQLFTVNRVRAVFDGLKEQLKLRFLQGEFFDKSSCGVWETRGTCLCDAKPGAHCLLEEIAIENREDFLASATTLAGAKREESRHIKKILDRLKTIEGKALLELLGKHRAHVGDLIIFWEVPDGWTILSRDLTFKILSDKHRPSIDFYMVRLPRIQSDAPCKLRPDDMLSDVDGVLVNHNAKGARIRAPSVTVKERQRVTVTADEFRTNRVGEVSEFDTQSDQTPQSSFGLRFKVMQSGP